jgi:thiol:disulfide interchange protein DsbA
MVVNGKYLTSGSLAGSHENMLKVLNQLISQESKAAPAK